VVLAIYVDTFSGEGSENKSVPLNVKCLTYVISHRVRRGAIMAREIGKNYSTVTISGFESEQEAVEEFSRKYQLVAVEVESQGSDYIIYFEDLNGEMCSTLEGAQVNEAPALSSEGKRVTRRTIVSISDVVLASCIVEMEGNTNVLENKFHVQGGVGASDKPDDS